MNQDSHIAKRRGKSGLGLNQFLIRLVLPTALLGSLTFILFLSFTSDVPKVGEIFHQLPAEYLIEEDTILQEDIPEQSGRYTHFQELHKDIEKLLGHLDPITADHPGHLSDEHQAMLDSWKTFLMNYEKLKNEDADEG